MAEKKLTPEEVQALGLNEPAPREAAPAPTSAPEPEPPAYGPNLAHQALQGFWQRWSDELIGKATAALLPLKGPGAGYRAPSGEVVYAPADVEKAARDRERLLLAAGREAHPVGSFLSEMGGDIVSQATLARALPAGAASKLMSPAGQAGMGFVGGVGASESESLPAQLLQGAGTAALSAGGATLGRRLGDWAARRLGRAAERSAAKTVVEANKDAERLMEISAADRAARVLAREQGLPEPKTELEELGRRMLDEGFMTGRTTLGLPIPNPFQSAENIADRAAVRAMGKGEDIGEVLRRAQEIAERGRAQELAKRGLGELALPPAGIHGQRAQGVLEELAGSAEKSAVGRASGGTGPVRRLAEEFGKQGPMTFPEFHAERVAIDKGINWDSVTKAVGKAMGKKSRGAVEGLLLEELERQAGPDIAAEYLKNKDAYEFLQTILAAADTPITRQFKNRFFGLTDHLVGAAAAGKAPTDASATMTGLMWASLNKFARERGRSAAAVLEDWLADQAASGVLGTLAPAAGRAGGPAAMRAGRDFLGIEAEPAVQPSGERWGGPAPGEAIDWTQDYPRKRR